MYFKKAGGKVQVLAYRGYDKVKKRAIVKMVGSISGQHFKPSVAQGDSLTVEEKAEIQTYIEKEKQKHDASMQQWISRSLPEKLGDAIEAIKAGNHQITEQWAEGVWNGMDELGRLLRKAGYGKHKTIRKEKGGEEK